MTDVTRRFRRTARTAWALAAAAALAWTAGTTPAFGQQAADTAVVEEISVRVGPDGAQLAAELSDGSRTTVALRDGEVLVDGEERASYSPGGQLASAWRDFLRDRVDPGGANLGRALRQWSAPSGADSAAADALSAAVAELAAVAERGEPAAGSPAEAAGGAAQDTGELTDQATRVVPPGRRLDELRDRLDRLRDALDRIGRGAVGALGNAALVVHDDYEIDADRTVDGHVALLGGELTVSGDVDGDVLVLDGELTLESGSAVEGDVLQVGGTVTNRGGRIGGELVSVGGDEAITREMDEPADPGPDDGWDGRYGPDRGIGHVIWDNVREGFSNLSLTLSFFIVLAILGAIPVYFAREKFEVTVDTVRHSFGRSFLLGLAAQVLFFPALVVLAVGILTIPLIPVLMLAVALAAVGGYVAVAYALGDVMRSQGYEQLRRLGRGPYRTLLLGLAALQILYVVISFLDFFGGVAGPLYGLTWFGATTVTWIAYTAGLGAVALSYAGTRDDYATPGGPGGGGGEPPVPAGRGETPPPGPETAAPAPEAGPGGADAEEADRAPGARPGPEESDARGTAEEGDGAEDGEERRG